MMNELSEEQELLLDTLNHRNYVEMNYQWLKKLHTWGTWPWQYSWEFRPKGFTTTRFHKATRRGVEYGIIRKKGRGPSAMFVLSDYGEKLVAKYERERKDNGDSHEEES